MRFSEVNARCVGFLTLAGACLGLAGAIMLPGCGTKSSVQSTPPTQVGAQPARPRIQRFDPAGYKGKTGKIVTNFKHESRLYMYKVDGGKRTPYEMNSKNGVFVVPVGQYEFLQYLVMPSSTAASRAPAVSGRYEKQLLIAVTDGSTYKLKAGPPFAASIKVAQRGADNVQMDLLLVGSGGERCTLMSSKAPEFQVVAKSGSLLQEGKFKYG